MKPKNGRYYTYTECRTHKTDCNCKGCFVYFVIGKEARVKVYE